MNWIFWKKKVVKPEPFVTETIDVEKIKTFCRYPEAEEFIKLLKKDRENIARVEIMDLTGDQTKIRKGEYFAYTMIIANMLDVRKEEKVYARKSGE